jgi:hypothetical protein
MRKFSKYYLVLVMLFATTSCLDVEEPEPEDPTEQLEELMVGAQFFLSEWLSGDFATYPLMWTQQLSGVRGTHLQLELYNAQQLHFDDMWKQFYMDLIQRLFLIDFVASENEAPVYLGISKILQAFAIGMATDAWGDMPLSQVSKYYSFEQNPAYDKQEDVYDTLFDLLDEAILLLDTEGTHPVRPRTGVDFYYEGDVSKWLQAARLLKLKFSLRTGHASESYDQSFSLIQQGGMFTGEQDDMIFPYGLLNGVDNPWYLFDFQVGNVRVGAHFVTMLMASEDPRLTRFVKMTTSNEYVGAGPGSMNLNASRLASSPLAIANADRRLVILSYAEQKFIESEVYARMGMQEQADGAYNQGVVASLAMHSARNEGWETVNARAENVDLEQIMAAKYIALFLNPEVWTDWRRTGYPDLAASAGNVNEDMIPRHFLYPTSESVQNAGNMPDDVSINTRMWWDE